MDMRIGIDDTDSPQGMCTTYLGAFLARRLIREHMQVREARLVVHAPAASREADDVGKARVGAGLDPVDHLARAFEVQHRLPRARVRVSAKKHGRILPQRAN